MNSAEQILENGLATVYSDTHQRAVKRYQTQEIVPCV
jgi:hypothetical protein